MDNKIIELFYIIEFIIILLSLLYRVILFHIELLYYWVYFYLLFIKTILMHKLAKYNHNFLIFFI